MTQIPRRSFLAAFGSTAVGGLTLAAMGQSHGGDIPTADRIQPAQLAKMLKGGAKPLLLQVGFERLYDEGHIPGAEYAGPAAQAAGIQNLKAKLAGVAHSREIVIYCGCCPWSRCPNIRPAFRTVKSMGFSRVRALYLATNFGVNWVEKGYPITKGA